MRYCGRRARLFGVAIAAVVANGSVRAGDVTDAETLAISQKHCVPCHARNPTHAAFDKPPRNVLLETVEELRIQGANVLEQVVENRNMPLGNQTEMTEEERDTLARWIAALK